MKKLLTVLLSLILCFSICACGGSNSGMDKETEQIIESFFSQYNPPELIAQVEESYVNYQELSGEEIKSIIEGKWLAISNEPWTTLEWHTYDIKDGVRSLDTRYLIEDGITDISEIYEEDLYDEKDYKIKDNVLYFGDKGYKVYKMHDNFYLLKNIEGKTWQQVYDEKGYVQALDFIYTPLNEVGKLVYRNSDWEDYIPYIEFTYEIDIYE